MAGTVAVVGSGLIGRAWAMIFARAGWTVRLYDAAPGVAEAAIGLCATGLQDLAAAGLCDDPQAAAARIDAKPSLAEAVSGVDFVQENGPEDQAVKQTLFAELDRLTPADAIIASSSSAIRVSLFTEALPGRARCLIGHPVNPPHLIPLVELSGAPWTAPDTIARARAIYAEIGQVPIAVLKEIEGFILNRLQGVLLAESFRLVEEGLCLAAGSGPDGEGRARAALVVHGAVRDDRAECARRDRGLLRALHRVLQTGRGGPGAAQRLRPSGHGRFARSMDDKCRSAREDAVAGWPSGRPARA